MNTCSWLYDNDEPCGNLVEGRTNFCASHNKTLRKEKQQEEKAIEKRNSLIEKARQKNKEPRKMPNKVSDKRKELNKEYFKLVEQFKKDNPECKIKANEFCTTKTDDPHHKRGRGVYLMDVSTWIPCCRSCHVYAESHPLEAKEKGWSMSRLAKYSGESFEGTFTFKNLKTEPHKI